MTAFLYILLSDATGCGVCRASWELFSKCWPLFPQQPTVGVPRSGRYSRRGPMLENSVRPWQKRVLRVTAVLIGFVLLFLVAIRVTVTEMFRGIEQSRATGLSAVAPWDPLPMLQKSAVSVDDAISGLQISRSADLRMRSYAFDHSVATLKEIVTIHHGYLDDLRTESRSGHGRALAALVTVPSNEFDPTVSGLKTLGPNRSSLRSR